MPYARHSRTDRDKVRRRLTPLYSGPVPRKAVDQYIEVWNSMYERTGDERRAFAAAYSMAQQRATGNTHASAGVAMIGRTLAATVGRRVLLQLDRILTSCHCAKEHEPALQAVKYAIKLGAGTKGPGAHARAGVAGGEGWSGGEAKVNTRWAWEMIAKQIYQQGDRLFLAVREMLQNSRDAKAKNIWVDWTDSGQVDGVDVGTLVFSDDGKGMDRSTVENVFLSLGESMKDVGDLGGFGAAKAAILTASVNGWDWEIRTRNVHAMSTAAGAYQVRTVPEEIQGTAITLRNVKGGWMQTPLGSGEPGRRIQQLISTSEMRGIVATVNGQTPTPYFEGRRGRVEEGFEGLDWGRSTVKVKSYKRIEGSGGSIIVRVKGLAQFAIPAPYNAKFERDYVLDFEIPPDLDPRSSGYPFNAGRDSFSWDSPARQAFEMVRDTITLKSGEKDRDPNYEIISPDSTDPREQKAERKLADTLESVLTSKGFESVFEDLDEAAGKMHQVLKSIGVEGGTRVVNSDELSPKPAGEHETGPESSSALPEPLVAFVTADPQRSQTAFGAFAAWLLNAAEWTDRLHDNLKDAMENDLRAYAVDEIIAHVKDVVTRENPDVSQLHLGWALAKLVEALDARTRSSDAVVVQQRKKRGDLNPFGGAAIIMISRHSYGEDRGKQFRKNARRYFKHLVWWEFVVKTIVRVLKATGKAAVEPGVGFVLDDEVLGLTREDGKYVMVNPEALDAITISYKEQAFIPAAYIHGLACHELAHAARIAEASSAAHNEYWSVLRENWAKDTLFLLPLIEEVGAKLLKMKRRRSRASSPRSDDATTKALRAKLEELEDERSSLTNALDAADRRANAAVHDLAEARADLYELRERAPKEPDLTGVKELAHRLSEMVQLEEFRQWVGANPELLAPYGVAPAHFLEALQEPGAMDALLREIKTGKGHEAARALGVDEREANDAYHAACGCGRAALKRQEYRTAFAWASPVGSAHAACPGCGGTCGGAPQSGHVAQEALQISEEGMDPLDLFEASGHAPAAAGGLPPEAERRRRIREAALEGERGRYWYQEAEHQIRTVARAWGVDPIYVAVAVAATSPATPVISSKRMARGGGTSSNIGKARRVVKRQALTGKGSSALNPKSPGITVLQAFEACRDSGEPSPHCLEVAFPKPDRVKTHSFVRNLLGYPDPVTVDTLISRGVAGHEIRVTEARHQAIAEDIRAVAQELGWAPREVMAAAWTAWGGSGDLGLSTTAEWSRARPSGAAPRRGVKRHARASSATWRSPAIQKLLGATRIPRYEGFPAQEQDDNDSPLADMFAGSRTESSVRRRRSARSRNDLIPGGLAAGRPDSDFDPDQLERGMQAEFEHTPDPRIAREIAKDHLMEDPDYYEKLDRLGL